MAPPQCPGPCGGKATAELNTAALRARWAMGACAVIHIDIDIDIDIDICVDLKDVERHPKDVLKDA